MILDAVGQLLHVLVGVARAVGVRDGLVELEVHEEVPGLRPHDVQVRVVVVVHHVQVEAHLRDVLRHQHDAFPLRLDS